MRVTEAQLRAQFDRATVNWSWIFEVERDCNLPPYLLFALGSRETNLRNVRQAPPGLGLGIWQRDAGVFKDLQGREDEYMLQVLEQATDAGNLLRSHFVAYRSEFRDTGIPIWKSAVCAYNAGRGGVRRVVLAGADPDTATTNGDYGSDVLERWSFMCRWGHRLL